MIVTANAGQKLPMNAAAGRGRRAFDMVPEEVRERVVAWLRYEMKKRNLETYREMAKKLDVSTTYVYKVLNEQQSVGMGLVWKMHHHLHISADALFDEWPPGYKP